MAHYICTLRKETGLRGTAARTSTRRAAIAFQYQIHTPYPVNASDRYSCTLHVTSYRLLKNQFAYLLQENGAKSVVRFLHSMRFERSQYANRRHFQ